LIVSPGAGLWLGILLALLQHEASLLMMSHFEQFFRGWWATMALAAGADRCSMVPAAPSDSAVHALAGMRHAGGPSQTRNDGRERRAAAGAAPTSSTRSTVLSMSKEPCASSARPSSLDMSRLEPGTQQEAAQRRWAQHPRSTTPACPGWLMPSASWAVWFEPPVPCLKCRRARPARACLQLNRGKRSRHCARIKELRTLFSELLRSFICAALAAGSVACRDHRAVALHARREATE
jgi:hypothetical protein